MIDESGPVPEPTGYTPMVSAPRDLLETATADENYGALTRFFQEVDRHLAPGGRMPVFFGTSGDMPYLRHLIDHAGLHTTVVAEADTVKDGWRVDYVTFRVTR